MVSLHERVSMYKDTNIFTIIQTVTKKNYILALVFISPCFYLQSEIMT